jgi:hypothetical protein
VVAETDSDPASDSEEEEDAEVEDRSQMLRNMSFAEEDEGF